MDWSLIALRRLSTTHHLLPMKALFFPLMDFPLARTNPLITHVAEGQRVTVPSIMKDPLWLLMRQVESRGWIKNGVQSYFIFRKDGLQAFWNTKHLLRLDHSCAIAIPNSGLVSGAGLFIFRPCGCVQLCMLDVEHCFQTAACVSQKQLRTAVQTVPHLAL